MMDFKRRLAIAAVCGVSSFALARAALAQSTVQSAVQSGADAPAEVVVTAQKRVEKIQDVPEQVTVISSQFMDQYHATSLADIAAYVPGLRVTSGGTPGQTTLSLRGIFPVSSNIAVATYVDDTPVGGSSLYSNAEGFSLDLLPYDVANIQVLSGPQGTLYGASALGGLLKYELIQPSLHTFHGDVGGDVLAVENGSGAGGGGRASVNGPLVDGKLGFIASYAYESTPGYVDNALTGQGGENGVRQQGARLGLLWEPTPRLKVELNAIYQQVDADGLGEVALDPTTLRPLYGELKDDNLAPQTFRKDIAVLSDRTTVDLGFANLTSVTSYEYTNVEQSVDETTIFGALVSAVGGPTPTVSPEDQHIQLRKYTEEVRLASKSDGPFEWLVGAYLTYEHSSLLQVVPLQNADGSAITPFTAAALGGLPLSSPGAVIYIPSIYREYAAFGDVTWRITPRLSLQAGLRYSYNSQNYAQVTAGSLEGPETVYGRANDSVATFSVSPSYKLNDDVNVYLRFASGYQPGGPNVALPGVPATVAADTLTQYEAGIKTQFLQRRGVFDVAVFYNQWDNIQVSTVGSADIAYLANGGDAKSEGVDAAGSFLVMPGLTVGATFNYTFAVFTNVIAGNGLGAHDGSPLPQTPRYSGSLQATYAHPLVRDWKYSVGAAVRLQGSRFSATNYTDLFYKEPAYGALDANLALSNDRYTVRLFARNLTDVRTYDSFNANDSLVTGTAPQVEGVLIQPRTIGIALDAHF